MEHEEQEISDSLLELLTGKNIQSEDLNYNCVLAAFIIKEGDLTNTMAAGRTKGGSGEAIHTMNFAATNKVQTAIEIARLIKDEGIEILTSSKRFLSQDEAFFLRNRMVAQSERKLAKTLSQDFRKPSYEN